MPAILRKTQNKFECFILFGMIIFAVKITRGKTLKGKREREGEGGRERGREGGREGGREREREGVCISLVWQLVAYYYNEFKFIKYEKKTGKSKQKSKQLI